MITKVDRNYLEINSIKELNYSQSPNNKCELFEINPPDFQINKFFYKQIGSDHRWIDRLVWDDQKWISFVNNPNVKTYVLKENEREREITRICPDCSVFRPLQPYLRKTSSNRSEMIESPI